MTKRQIVSCPACGTGWYADYHVHLNPWLPQDYKYSKCQLCDLVWVNPRPQPEEVEQIYTDHTNPFDKDEYESLDAEHATLLRLVKSLQKIQPTGRILDMGCARGDFLKIAQDHGYEVQGTDLSTQESPHSNIPIYSGFLKDAQFPTASFDIVVTRNTLEHLFNPNQDLSEINRILKPGGILYVKVPHRKYEEGWRCKLFFGFKSLYSPPVHLNHFHTGSLIEILNNNGFTKIRWTSEKPSQPSNRLKSFIVNTSYGAINILQKITLGKFFPKPVLCILARKTGESTTDNIF